MWGYSLKNRPCIGLTYGIGTSNESVPEMASDHSVSQLGDVFRHGHHQGAGFVGSLPRVRPAGWHRCTSGHQEGWIHGVGVMKGFTFQGKWRLVPLDECSFWDTVVWVMMQFS